jgi:uncharacterized membrane protein YfcA
LPLEYLWLIPLGFVIGAYGTLIGAGGGFVLVPILLLLYPQAAPETLTSISLAVNALSGKIHGTWIIRGLAFALGGWGYACS